MIVDVGYTYEASIVRTGRRKPESVRYDATVAVHVAEPSANEAPVAIRYREEKRRGGDREVELRWYEGRLWKLWEPSMAVGEPQEPRTLEWYAENICGPDGGTPNTLEGDTNVREVVSSDRDEAEERARSEPAEVVGIGGFVWRRVEEPVLVASVMTDGSHCWVAVDEVTQNQSKNCVFRIDHGHRIPELIGDAVDPGVPIVVPEVEIVLPEVVGYRADEANLLSEGVSVLRRMKDLIAEGDRAIFDAYADLRDVTPLNGRDSDKYPTLGDCGPDFDFADYAARVAACVAASKSFPDEYGARTWWQGHATAAVARFEGGVECDPTSYLTP